MRESLMALFYRSVCFYEFMPENILMTHGIDHGRGDTLLNTQKGAEFYGP